MRYERRKEFAALLSVSSVVVALSASVVMNVMSDRYFTSYTSLTVIAAALAATAAYYSIMISRRLARERERRRVFLIYAREDLDAARKLAQDLRNNGFAPWLDVDEIAPGQVWQRAVIRALEESAVALVLVSPHLMKNGFVQEELKVALDTLQERDEDVSPVIPVRLDSSVEVPDRLSHIQWVDLFDHTGMERLLAGLRRIVRHA